MYDIDGISLRKLLENAHIGVVIHRWDTSIVYANPTALRLLRLSYDQLVGKDARDPRWNFLDESMRRMQVEEYPVNKVKRFRSALSNEVLGVIDGDNPSPSWFMVNAYCEFDPEADDGFVVVTFSDITNQKNSFSFSQIVRNAEDIVIVTTADNIDEPFGPKIVYVNRAFERVTGYEADEAIDETPRILQGKDTDPQARKRIREALKEKKPVRETLLNYRKSGHPYWLEMNIVPLCNQFDEVTHFAAIERDVTERIYREEQLKQRNRDLKRIRSELEALVAKRTRELRELNHRLERLAYYDCLTDIPNRRSFLRQAGTLRDFSEQRSAAYVLGVVDIDRFKSINDAHGHDAGDRVLCDVANGLAKFCRREDAFGRLGGEEFGVAMLFDGTEHVRGTFDRLREKLAGLNIKLGDAGGVRITVSIGVAISAPPFSESVEEQLVRADRALYVAKENGRNRVEVS